MIYTLKNLGSTAITWKATASVDWVNLATSGAMAPAAAGGMLQPMQSTYLSVSVNSKANSFSPGVRNGLLFLTNLTTGEGNTTRNIVLTVQPTGSALEVTPLTHMSFVGKQGGPFVG